jgi:hypothetical protein
MNRRKLSPVLFFLLSASLACAQATTTPAVSTLSPTGASPGEAGTSPADVAPTATNVPEPTPSLEPSPVPDPVDIALTLASDLAVEAEIGLEGGTLEAVAGDGTRFILEIPEEALFSPVLVRMTPAESVAGVPFEAGALAAVRLEPEGLVFYRSATLRIVLPNGVPLEDVAAFATFTGGADFHLTPDHLEAGEVIVPISHFSDYGVTTPHNEEIARINQNYNPTAAEAIAKNDFGTANRLIDDDVAALLDASEKILKDWFNHSVVVRLQNAASNDDWIDQAVGEYLSWSAMINDLAIIYGAGDFAGRFAQEHDLALDALAAALKAAFDRAHLRCVRDNNPVEALRMFRWGLVASYLNVWGRSGLDQAAAKEQLFACFSFDFKFRSVVEGQVDDDSFTSQVAATIPLELRKSFDYYDSSIAGTGPLPFELHTSTGVHPSCTLMEKAGSMLVYILLDLNLNSDSPQVESVELWLSFQTWPEEIVRCTVSGQTTDTVILKWRPFFMTANQSFFDLSTGIMKIRLDIVKRPEVFAEFSLSGPIAIPDGTFTENSTYELIHNPK